MEKEIQYTGLLLGHINEIFSEESSNYINPRELADEANAKAFLHALANMVPTRIYQELTGDEVNNLDFNHIANKLCFEFSKLAAADNE